MKKQRVIFFIDGFNLYHSIADLSTAEESKNHLKWLDLSLLCRQFVDDAKQEIIEIYYFSAYADWLVDSVARHKKYISALKSVGVHIVLGNFKKKTIKCKNCHKIFYSHEEKETDVNIATYILRGAINDEYDRAVIISSDSDFASAIKMSKDLAPEKEFVILSPPERYHSRDLIRAAGKRNSGNKHPTIKELHLSRALFADKVVADKGVIKRPEKYNPPLK